MSVPRRSVLPVRFFLGLALLTGGACRHLPFSTGARDPRFEAGPIIPWSRAAHGNGHYYQAVAAPAGVNWADAQAWALAHGGYLATITSAAENDFVFQLITDLRFWGRDPWGNLQGPWLGGFQPEGSPEPDGGWQWLNHDGAFAYTNWMPPDQPDNKTPDENRVEFFTHTAYWNDAPGEWTYPHGFVVEYSDAPAASADRSRRNATSRPVTVPLTGELVIFSAIFSGQDGSADVTALVAELARPGAAVFFASPKWLGTDPAPNWKKKLSITYRFRGRPALLTTGEGGAISYEILAANAGGDPSRPPRAVPVNGGEPKILNAWFGTGNLFADVTARVADLIKTKPDGFDATPDELQSDPTPGLIKEFMVVYEYGDQRQVFTVQEGGACSHDLLARNPAKP